jgi:hypothetical protein
MLSASAQGRFSFDPSSDDMSAIEPLVVSPSDGMSARPLSCQRAPCLVSVHPLPFGKLQSAFPNGRI